MFKKFNLHGNMCYDRSMQVYIPAIIIENYDRQTNQKTNKPTDGHGYTTTTHFKCGSLMPQDLVGVLGRVREEVSY